MSGAWVEHAYHAAATIAVPALVLRGLYDSAWRKTLADRLGQGRWSTLRELNAANTIWVHAASVGEVGGVAPIIEQVSRVSPNTSLLLTTTSVTGQAEVSRRSLDAKTCLLPFDHPLLLKRMLKSWSPKLFVAAETELWPALLFALARRDVPLVLVNGRISEYSYPRYLRMRPLISRALSCFDLLLVQTELDAERFLKLGANKAQVKVVGSTKYDFQTAADDFGTRASLFSELGLLSDQPCIVAGSVRPGEDEAVVNGYLHAKEAVPGLQLILAPRHPEKFGEAERLLSTKGLAFHRRSSGKLGDGSSVLLLDTMGELRKVYSLASIAFVGGTLVDIGGHNPLEPAAYGVPTIVGPHVGNVLDAIAQLKAKDGLLMVNAGEELGALFRKLLENPLLAKKYGEIGLHVAQDNAGATARVMELLMPYLTEQSQAPLSRRAGSR